MKDFFEKDAFAKLCGIELISAGDGRARAKMPVQDIHKNSMGMVHGGAIFALADAAFAAASNSHDHQAVAININISYLKGVQDGVLFAEAEEINSRGRIGAYSIKITNQQDEVAAIFEGLAYRKF